MKPELSRPKIKLIRSNYLHKTITNKAMAAQLHVSRHCVQKHINEFILVGILYPKQKENINIFFPKANRPRKKSKLKVEFEAIILSLIENASAERIRVTHLWMSYRLLYPNGYQLGSFKHTYNAWNKENPICKYGHKKVTLIGEDDPVIFEQWRRGNNHNYWAKSVVITESYKGTPFLDIVKQVKYSIDTVQKWIRWYNEFGLKKLIKDKGMSKYVRFVNPRQERKRNLSKLIHELPKLHGVNRASWKLEDLSDVYFKLYGDRVSCSGIRGYLKQEGYVFKKAKMVLTSPDPKFREKLEHIKEVLAGLKSTERFFSIDEFGPCAVKMKQGWSFAIEDKIKTVQINQKSKGWYICTAALELSSNQVTHFFSRTKNTDEMIKLIEILLLEYQDATKLYLSWDAASWHSSKRLDSYLNGINSFASIEGSQTPGIELVPLPISAQFLNVIESVFSGMARAVIANSDYHTLNECKSAITEHFNSRNQHFKANPKKAGKTLWGKELVIPVFDEANNCKDAKYSR